MRCFPASCLLLLVATQVNAQVGYDPQHSPFRSIEHGTWLEFYGGHLYGNGGPIPVGPRDGGLMGLRVDFRSQHALQLSLGGWTAGTVRNVIDANDSVAVRVKGPYKQRVYGIETHVQFNLTGGKTWHRLAPYAGISFGVAFAKKGPASDTSGYAFGTKIQIAPGIGTRLFVSNRLFVKAEAQSIIWKVKYPLNYSIEPVKQPGTAESPNAVNPTGKTSDYAFTPKLIFGLGWAF